MSEPDFPEGRWRARWIWFERPRMRRVGPLLAGESEPRERVGCFRRRFRLEQIPERAPARVTADSRYVLWLNGTELARGPARSNLRRLRYDELDLAKALRRGENVLAVLARRYARPTPWWAPVPAAIELGAGAFAFEANLGAGHWLGSDEHWRALASDAWASAQGRGISSMPLECFDARRLAPDWRELDFDDSAWTPATLLAANSVGFSGRHEPPSHPYGPLFPRAIPQLGRVLRVARLHALHRGPASELADDPFDQVRQDLAGATPRAAPDRGAESTALELSEHDVVVATFDFGEIVAGTLLLEVEAPPGARFDLAVAELARPDDGAIDPEGEHAGLRYVARGSDDRFESFDALGLRFAAIAIRSRGVSSTSAAMREGGRVVLRRVALHERLYPREPGPAFECSEPRLERIWAVGRRTVDLNSHDAYLDCPTREQRAWTGDFVVHQMVDLATNADWRLARRHVELAASPRPDGLLPMAASGDIEFLDAVYIPDWALHWIRALHNLWRYTGDRELTARLLPVAEGVLRWFVPFQRSDGLLSDVTGWVIIDWSSVTTVGRSSALCALWARGLRDFAEMAAWLGDSGRAAWARRTYDSLASGFEQFWDPERRLYVDHIEAGARGRPASQHAQAAALAAGLVPPERVARVVELLLDRSREVHATWSRASGDARYPGPEERGVGGPYLVAGPPEPWWDVERQLVVAQPFFRYVTHDALASAGRAELIAELCLDWQALLERCPTSLSETWYGGTTCHGWCATPTRDLLVYTLGVTPAEPGFARARIAPRLGVLEWARGAVPTPFGWLHVHATRETVEVESPIPFDFIPAAGSASALGAGRHALKAGSPGR